VGVAGVLAAYTQALASVKLYGPTNFAEFVGRRAAGGGGEIPPHALQSIHAPLRRASSVMYLCFRGMQGKEGDGVPPQVLAEIPEQLLGFMASKGIKPNPPPAVDAVQANAPPAYQPPAVAPVMATAVAR
jgi:hypothetical protein